MQTSLSTVQDDTCTLYMDVIESSEHILSECEALARTGLLETLEFWVLPTEGEQHGIVLVRGKHCLIPQKEVWRIMKWWWISFHLGEGHMMIRAQKFFLSKFDNDKKLKKKI